MTDCLAATGASTAPLLVLGLLVVVTGIAVTVLLRRRRRAAMLAVGVVLALLAGGLVVTAPVSSAQATTATSSSCGEGADVGATAPDTSPLAPPADPGSEPDLVGNPEDTPHAINFRIVGVGVGHTATRLVIRRDWGGVENNCVQETSPVSDQRVFTEDGGTIQGSMSYTEIGTGPCGGEPTMVKWHVGLFIDSALVGTRTLRAVDLYGLGQRSRLPFPLPAGLQITGGHTRFVDDVDDPDELNILRTVTQSTGNDTDPIVFEIDRSQPFLQSNTFNLDSDLDSTAVDDAGVGTWTWSSSDVGDCVTSWFPVDPISIPTDFRPGSVPLPWASISVTTRGPLRPLTCSERTDPLILETTVRYEGPTGRTAEFRLWLDRRLKSDPAYEAWLDVALLNCEVVDPGAGAATCSDHLTEWTTGHDPILVHSGPIPDDRNPLILTVR